MLFQLLTSVALLLVGISLVVIARILKRLDRSLEKGTKVENKG